MIFLLDTSAFSDLMRAHPAMDSHLAALQPGDRTIICTIVRGEIAYGLARLPEGKRRAALAAKAAALLAAVPCEAIPPAAGEHYAAMKLARERRGLALDENDLWIAATALAPWATLVTRDTDFRQVDGLPVENWTGV